MSEDLTALKKEQEILRAVRKTLAQVVVDITPESSALRSPLKPQTIEDIRMCFGLVSAREREIVDMMNHDNNDRPHFIDEPRQVSNVLHFQPSAPQKDSAKKGTEK